MLEKAVKAYLDNQEASFKNRIIAKFPQDGGLFTEGKVFAKGHEDFIKSAMFFIIQLKGIFQGEKQGKDLSEKFLELSGKILEKIERSGELDKMLNRLKESKESKESKELNDQETEEVASLASTLNSFNIRGATFN